MIIEAVATLKAEPKTAIRYLKLNPKHGARLTQHFLVPDSFQAMGIEILSLEVDDIRASADINKDDGLPTNDAINLALMRQHRLICIASNDSKSKVEGSGLDFAI